MLTLYEIGADRAPTEKALLRLSSYFGGLLCVAWSHDDRLLFTGGEDDLVSVCSVQRRAVVARGQGHRSWVNALSVDPPDRDTRPRTHRIASGGADACLLLWEFTEEEDEEEADTEEEGSVQEAGEPPVVPPPPFKAVPRLQPVAGAQLHLQPISSLLAGRNALLTACVGGQVQTWARPEPNPHPDPNPTATRNPTPEPTPK